MTLRGNRIDHGLQLLCKLNGFAGNVDSLSATRVLTLHKRPQQHFRYSIY